MRRLPVQSGCVRPTDGCDTTTVRLGGLAGTTGVERRGGTGAVRGLRGVRSPIRNGRTPHSRECATSTRRIASPDSRRNATVGAFAVRDVRLTESHRTDDGSRYGTASSRDHSHTTQTTRSSSASASRVRSERSPSSFALTSPDRSRSRWSAVSSVSVSAASRSRSYAVSFGSR